MVMVMPDKVLVQGINHLRRINATGNTMLPVEQPVDPCHNCHRWDCILVMPRSSRDGG